MLTEKTMLKANPEIIYSPIDDEVVMMNIDSGAYFGLDNIASVIWHKMDAPISYANVIESLLDEYDVDVATCKSEVSALIDKMIEEELVVVE